MCTGKSENKRTTTGCCETGAGFVRGLVLCISMNKKKSECTRSVASAPSVGKTGGGSGRGVSVERLGANHTFGAGFWDETGVHASFSVVVDVGVADGNARG